MPEALVDSPVSAGTESPEPAPSPSAPSSGRAPIGADAIRPARPITSTSAPTPVDITDDTLIRVPGQAQPVKYSDYIKRQQADYTRKTQAAAAERKAVEAERQKLAADRQRQDEHFQQLAASLAGRTGQPDASEATIAALAKMPSVSGQVMAQIVQAIRTDGFGAIKTAFESRDKVAELLFERIQRLEAALGSVNGERAETQFSQKIDNWMRDLGIPPEYKNFAMETYLAHEGEDLDEQFPEILQNRFQSLQSLFRQHESKRVEAARNSRFAALPGRGGNGVTGKPLQFTGRETAKELTDAIWDSLQADGRT